MPSVKNYNSRTFLLEVLAILLGLLFLAPFYFVIVNSMKTFGDLLVNSANLPKSINFDNYIRAWEIMKFPKVFMNSLWITVISNVGLVIISSMAAYRLVRRPSRFNNLVFLAFVAAMVIPFQSIMIPLVRVASELNLMDSRTGLIICYFGFGVSLNVFLYHGFIKSIPKEIEESATVDGCTPYGVFWKIIFPLLKPMSVTVILLNSLWIWNDFLLPLLVLNSPDLRTIPLATFAFFGQYTKQWDLALAALVLGVIPIILFFLSMQKYIIEGITAGSVKG
ncbi:MULTISPECIES: carbohydrate ABC transporter permease [Paenibacillus]|uniref:Sugar ABC transporter permease n=1 Tax=Paenibacillus naphthalenovorans TaxID=162209 RepID=A0A0U2M174_9BACL|nr:MULTISPECIES: carbohydrate ABC transporter permease [Paenibacillus]ALS20752.1 sugar ABC transporter permease [Paenibacillus naphthalenovorans]NTZ17831.1 carbohydrate ABC transporter permease [Paenibacillus sp. JMULE4]GCL70781.1 carbohydrate ABC transporter permease [Paenibacillus naphthalenovorans]SDI23175.1 raffinose/stachyose/melibiose transport system permease protein [Paenibacillus naphthalenovorans]